MPTSPSPPNPNPTSPDLYERLGVARDADDRAIRLAYRRLALRLHPDRAAKDARDKDGSSSASLTREEAESQFVRVGEAYEVLSDPERRAIYDAYGIEGVRAAAQGVAVPPMTRERAMELFFDFFRPPGGKRSETDKPSALHGAYVAGAGAVVAPVKGALAGGAVLGAGALAGTAIAASGVVRGARASVGGVRRAVGKGEANSNSEANNAEPSSATGEDHAKRQSQPRFPIASGLAQGAAVATGSVVAAGVLVGGGVVGAASNVRDGVSEIGQAVHGRYSQQQSQQQHQQRSGYADDAIVVRARDAETGRTLFAQAMQ